MRNISQLSQLLLAVFDIIDSEESLNILSLLLSSLLINHLSSLIELVYNVI